jgi:type I restriction enzyme S subunit
MYYSLLNTSFLDVTTGSAQPQITVGHLSKKQIFWDPSPLDRAAVANILGTLDNKIELNRRMSETLEAMARALFKSWFVDFDPVRAKAEGHDPRLPPYLVDLFPARFDISDGGEIPEGWELKPLDKVGRFLNGLAWPTSLVDQFPIRPPIKTFERRECRLWEEFSIPRVPHDPR